MTAGRAFHPAAGLAPGARVAVIAPASAFDRASFENGLAIIGARYDVRYQPAILERQRYLAGSDGRRLAELSDALLDPAIEAVFCARGGYGSTRLLRQLSTLELAAPKPLVGFSDITALHFWLQSLGIMSIHGPVLTQLGQLPAQTRQRLFGLLESTTPAAPLRGSEAYVPGVAEGPLLGGTLSVVTRLLGTPYLPSLEGAILLLEDVGERPYRLDRMWMHLDLAGVLRQVRGIALGSFTNCEEKDADYSAADVLRELATAAGLPCVAGFPIGHGAVNEPVPLGARVRLDAGARSLTFLEAAVTRGA
ncbi:MAG TPA: LD-carboxypeptidase [Steroidobacteraceae bacterium]|jgi:muramoyltetrapeptide carboxypeptidase|nr:LD-carboxypeptidase [Steroidobacteraceae bacterium]